jgi:hypothetical protein
MNIYDPIDLIHQAISHPHPVTSHLPYKKFKILGTGRGLIGVYSIASVDGVYIFPHGERILEKRFETT